MLTETGAMHLPASRHAALATRLPTTPTPTRHTQRVYWSTAELAAKGYNRSALRAAVMSGELIRVRRGRYVQANCAPTLLSAARLGGRVDCVTLLQEMGVFVQEAGGLHIQFEPDASRLPRRAHTVTAHWRASATSPTCLTVPIIEALTQAVRCQEARAAIATLDSALHLGLINKAGMADIFARLPRHYGVLRDLVDGRCESGPETLVRLVLRTLGCHVDLQVTIDGVGRVDFLVDGWLIIECDSQAFHSDWAARKRDLRRDRAAAERGYVTLRLLAEDIIWHRDDVRGAIAGVLRRGQLQR